MRLDTLTSHASILLLLGVVGLPACGNGAAAGEKEEKTDTDREASAEKDESEGSTDESAFDPEEYRRQMAEMGVEVTDEQLEQMKQAAEMMQKMQESGQLPSGVEMPTGMPTAMPTPPGQAPASKPAPTPAASRTDQGLHEAASMGDEGAICELLNRKDGLAEAKFQAGLAGEYDDPRFDNRLNTWNVESLCDGRALRAYANWADVSPMMLSRKGNLEYHDSWQGTVWRFELGSDGVAKTLTMTDSQGETTKLTRLGPPVSHDD